MWWLYDLVIRIYSLAIWLVASFRPKARAWRQGRQHNWQLLEAAVQKGMPTLWMHCASLGEFEQGRPILETFRRQYPHWQLVLSFFSPSGYMIRKNYPVVDHVCYLPADTATNARRFLNIVQPQLVIFVKYDFWLRHLQAAQQRGIPCLLVSALFRPAQAFFRWYGGPYKEVLHTFNHLFVQNRESAELLKQHNYQKVSIAGDTRIDRVLSIAQDNEELPAIANFVEGKACLICGSSWPQEEQMLVDFLTQNPEWNWKIIIAPHDISESHLQQIEQSMPTAVLRYSKADPSQPFSDYQILLIDNVGLLAKIYRYGTLAFIGGGFGKGIHNTLEAAAYGLPMLFGPNYQKFEEARQFVQNGAAYCVRDVASLTNVLENWKDKNHRQEAAQAARSYLITHRGATEKITTYLKELV